MSDTRLCGQVSLELAPALLPLATPRSPLQQSRRRGFDARVDNGREAVELAREDGKLHRVWKPWLKSVARCAWTRETYDRNTLYSSRSDQHSPNGQMTACCKSA